MLVHIEKIIADLRFRVPENLQKEKWFRDLVIHLESGGDAETLKVLPNSEGTFNVVDGVARLHAYKIAGRRYVPVSVVSTS